MHFRTLELLAFGHFTRRTLSFEPNPVAFHLVYGNNEAGKSTALRAVRDLLYGIPQQSSDTFLHAGPELLLAATLEDERGQATRIVRRKGRKNTLLDDEGAPLDEAAVLGPLLGSVDQTLFSSMFGLNHETLRHGARELLSGSGRVSESVFGAGAVGGRTHRLLTSLRSQAEELFTARGRGRKRINQEITDVREAHKRVAQQSTTAQGYQERHEELTRVSSEVDQVKEERAQLKVHKALLDRRLSTLPFVAKLSAVLRARQELGPVVDLPEALEEWRSDAVAQLEETQRKAEYSKEEIDRQKERLLALEVPDALLQLDAATVESLADRLGQFRKARLDLPKREAEYRAVMEDVQKLLLEIDPSLVTDQIESLRISKQDERRLRAMCIERVRLDAMLRERENSAKESQRSVALRKREFEKRPPQDTRPLLAALERARAQLDLEQALEDERRRGAQLERLLLERLTALGGFQGPPMELLNLALPTRSTVARFERDLRQAQQDVQRQERRLEELEAERASTERERQELLATGSVPSESELGELRRARDEVLLGLKQKVTSETFDRKTAAHEIDRLTERTHRVDAHADRLRAEATRVSKGATLEAALASNREQSQRASEKLDKTRAQLQAQEEAWQSLFSSHGISPLPPAEMAEWLETLAEHRQTWEQMGQTHAEVRRLESKVAILEKDLTHALSELGETSRTLFESLPQFVERCQTRLLEMQSRARAREDAEQRLHLAEEEEGENARRLAELQQQQKHFRGEWSKALKQLGLEKDAGADDVTSNLDLRSEMFHRFKEAGDLERRIKGILRDEEQLAQDVDQMVAKALPSAATLPLQDRAESLLRAHKKAIGDARERERLRLELSRHESELRGVEKQHSAANGRLAELLRLAQASDLSELSEVQKRAREARALEAQRKELEDHIVGLGEGESLETLLSKAQESSAEDLRQQQSRLEVELNILDERLETLVQRRTKAEAQLHELGEGAARAAEELAQCTARLRHSVKSYMKLQLAFVVLSREVERYREQHQGPVLRQSSELFPRLTLGAYSGLKTGFDKNDEPILLCVGKNGEEKRIDALSDGSRDQLYLSLRLATLMHFMQRTQPMPLVLDDILVHFDDERARAALRVLGEVATQAQVLFFTHHQRLVELAREAIPAERLHVCDLSEQSAAVA